MSINRHNYEEFFLLYVDNELKQDERLEVEHFVSQNPDLGVELKMLQEAVLNNEDLKFEDKEILFKEEQGISLENYEEYFVLLIDEELKKDEKAEVEKFVLKHPVLQEEFTLLQKAKLEPEKIIFEDKATLYRKERRILPLVLRLSAAAAVIGIIAFTRFAFDNTVTTNTNVVTAQNEVVQDKDIQLEKKSQQAVTKSTATTLNVKPAISLPGFKETKSSIKQVPLKEQAPVENVQLLVTTEKSKDRTISVATVKQEDNKKYAEAPVEVTTDYNTEITGSNKKIEYASKQVVKEEEVASHAVYRVVDTEEESNSIYIGGTQINKNKLKGLFRKAAVILGKKNRDNDEDKTVRIAGFELKTK